MNSHVPVCYCGVAHNHTVYVSPCHRASRRTPATYNTSFLYISWTYYTHAHTLHTLHTAHTEPLDALPPLIIHLLNVSLKHAIHPHTHCTHTTHHTLHTTHTLHTEPLDSLPPFSETPQDARVVVISDDTGMQKRPIIRTSLRKRDLFHGPMYAKETYAQASVCKRDVWTGLCMQKRWVDRISDPSEIMKGTYVCRRVLFEGPMYGKESYF